MNVALLSLIETNDYYIRNVLLTHTHESHAKGLKTLAKIYDFSIYAGSEKVLDFDCVGCDDGDCFEIDGISVHALQIRGHSADSLVYIIGSYLFSGDSFSAGAVGSAPDSYARELLIEEIKQKILSLDGNYLIFPGHGSPSTLEAERLINPIFAMNQ